MRILLINPNTMPDMTDLVVRVVSPHLPAGVALKPVTGRFGAHYIASRAAGVVAGHAALEAYAEHGQDCDAVYLACFGDPGLFALKELAAIPVIGMAEASCHAAAARAARFSIVTGGERWGPILHEFVAMLGLGDRLTAVETVAPNGAAIAADPDGAIALLAEACRKTAARDGAGAVILGGAGLAGLAARVQPLVDIPVLCSVETGIAAVLAAMRNPPLKPAQGDLAFPPPVGSVGLSERLAALLAKS
ncbi:aspartate/glutamate racemase family protein [Bosea sp. PAMC 26642]|uniref:aspartate/glutamate racemase family protein n=1 Tax=Bosea sp. (strain PAMC 26642) TaxID=1792307 RepID=UPI0007703548|nr:aspartate/glutamate racemase family protein [Bosea sp. PAMC 26642]AMJ61898.1 Asp/Glu racemase [Bosea sp. PAMC 26642]